MPTVWFHSGLASIPQDKLMTGHENRPDRNSFHKLEIYSSRNASTFEVGLVGQGDRITAGLHLATRVGPQTAFGQIEMHHATARSKARNIGAFFALDFVFG
nr:hypothetical protein CFP56_21776 [Quercus suber]